VRRDLVLIALAACGGGRDEPVPAAPAPTPVVRGSITADSTIAARDYLGPTACGECHPDEHARWSASLHAVMNQRASAGAVIGKFDGTVLAYQGGEVRFDRSDRHEPTMTLTRGELAVRYRVTRTIGTRGLQEYVGIQDGGAGDEVRLPFGWWPRLGAWAPQPLFDPWLTEQSFDAYAPVREPWAERCPWCHSTYPFEQRIARASIGVQQGTPGLGHGLEQDFVSAPGSERLAVERQVTVGISCESCHLGGRAHAAGAAIHFVPIGAVPRPGAPAATTFATEARDPAIVNAVCAQCHSGPSPRLPDGTATRNSSEALDLAASPCTTARCIDCHDPHRADARPGPALDARAVAACTGCHTALAEPAAARSHAGAGHDRVSCLDCHMPPVVLGIDRHVRTHRISSPTDRAMLAAAAPNACNLCHLDRSIRWTLDELRASYEVRLDPRTWDAYGELDASVGEVWLASKEPAIRLVAAAAYARAPLLGRAALPELLRLLDDPRPYVRAWGLFAVEDVLARELPITEYDPRAPAALRRRQLAKLRPR
jgi:predicted CXXCH cytochrome family protein